jgi:hypothetical protein
MSYALAFAPDAYSQWRALDPNLQERVLDTADEVADNPQQSTAEEMLRDFLAPGAGVDHYVFVRLVIDHPRHLVVVTGVIHYPRPRRGPAA